MTALTALTSEREKEIRRRAEKTLGNQWGMTPGLVAGLGRDASDLLAALDECRREKDEARGELRRMGLARQEYDQALMDCAKAVMDCDLWKSAAHQNMQDKKVAEAQLDECRREREEQQNRIEYQSDLSKRQGARIQKAEAELERLTVGRATLEECRRERDEAMGTLALVKSCDECLAIAAKAGADLAECRRLRDDYRELARRNHKRANEAEADPFLRYRDKITQTLTYISDKSGSGDYSQVIADMATELLGDLGVE